MPFQPYLFFNGRCDEAIEFYQKAVGAEVTGLLRFKQAPDPSMVRPETAEKVMHAHLRIGGGDLLVSDGMCAGETKFEGFALTLSLATAAEVDRRFNALAEGGEVRMPLDKTFFSPRFGMLTDRFGVGWMVMVEP
ncbi:MAG TPA: VOC family protein [Stellaceae bacterium]|jgi:PhnB protein|nr:VOC family protein [Stellaceae bacterium]